MKRLSQLIALLILISILLTSCGTYTPPADGGNTNQPTNPDDSNTNNPNNPDNQTEPPYTVTLNVNGTQTAGSTIDIRLSVTTTKESKQVTLRDIPLPILCHV